MQAVSPRDTYDEVVHVVRVTLHALMIAMRAAYSSNAKVIRFIALNFDAKVAKIIHTCKFGLPFAPFLAFFHFFYYLCRTNRTEHETNHF